MLAVRRVVTLIRALSVAMTVAVGGMLGAESASAVPPAGSAFGVESFETEVLRADGELETRAGAHPFSAQAKFTLNSYDAGGFKPVPIEEARRVVTRLPAGFTGNPQAATSCPLWLAASETRGGYPSLCPRSSWVGFISVDGGIDVSQPIVNVV